MSIPNQPFRAEIVSNARPWLFIGANNCDNCAERPVIGDGESRIWVFSRVSRGYMFDLDGFIADVDDGKVVVRLNSTKPWEVLWSDNEPASFSILVPGTRYAWTVTGTGVPGAAEVTLQEYTGEVSQLFSLSFKE